VVFCQGIDTTFKRLIEQANTVEYRADVGFTEHFYATFRITIGIMAASFNWFPGKA